MPMKLVYFNGRGVCEVARYMLHMSGVDYEDHRYPINHATFEKKVWCKLTFPAWCFSRMVRVPAGIVKPAIDELNLG